MSLRRQLDVLEVSGLIRLAEVQPDLAYLFRHALVQEAAYNSLLKQHRRALHLAVGEALEQASGTRATDMPAVLARHFDEGDDQVRALKYYVSAGDSAASKFATTESLANYARARELACELKTDSKLLRRIWLAYGRALEMTGRYTQADDSYRAMAELAQARADRSMELAAVIAQATIHSAPTVIFDPAVAEDLSEKALELAHTLNDRAAEAKIYWNLLLAQRFKGNFARATVYGDRSVAIAREFGLREQLAFTLNDMYQCLMALGRTEQGDAVQSEATAIWKELGNLPMLADSLSNAAEIQWLRGKNRQSIALARESLSISRSIGNIWGQSYSLIAGGFAYVEVGELEEGLQYLVEGIRLGEMAGFAVAEVGGRTMLGMLWMNLGALERARMLAVEAIAISEASMPFFRAGPLMLLGGVQRRTGELAESVETFQRARAAVTNMDMVSAPFLLAEDCEAALAAGDGQYVLAAATDQLQTFQKLHLNCFTVDARYYQARALRVLGRIEDARATLLTAFSEAEANESRRSLIPILAELVSLAAAQGSGSEAAEWKAEGRKVLDYVLEHIRDPKLRALVLEMPESKLLMGGAVEA